MIESLSNFCSSIICTIITVVILNMIIPDGKSKKYITFVLGVVVTIALINPLLNLLDIDISEVLALEENQYAEYKYDENSYTEAVKKTYNENLINDVINRLKSNGYNVSNVKVEYDTSLNPDKIFLDMESEDGYVQPVKIEVSQNKSSKVSELTKIKIKNIISENYGIKQNNIFIN